MRLSLLAALIVMSGISATAKQVVPQRGELDQALSRGFGTAGSSRGIPPISTPGVPNPNMVLESSSNQPINDPTRAGINYDRSFGIPQGTRIQPINMELEILRNGYDVLPDGTILYRSAATSESVEPVRPNLPDEQISAIYQEWSARFAKITDLAKKLPPSRRARVISSASKNAAIDLCKKNKVNLQGFYWIVSHGPEVVEQSDSQIAPLSGQPVTPTLPVASLNEVQHRAIFKDWSTQRSAALIQAQSMPASQGELYIRQVDLRLVKELTFKYNITHAELDAIENFGAKLNWW